MNEIAKILATPPEEFWARGKCSITTRYGATVELASQAYYFPAEHKCLVIGHYPQPLELQLNVDNLATEKLGRLLEKMFRHLAYGYFLLAVIASN